MKAIVKILFAALTLVSTTVLQAGNANSYSTTAVGHMAVTLLAPAALINQSSIQFENVGTESTSIQQTGYGNVKIAGNRATYSVTISNQSTILENLTALSNTDFDGATSINIGASLHLSDNNDLASIHEESPVIVTVNYN